MFKRFCFFLCVSLEFHVEYNRPILSMPLSGGTRVKISTEPYQAFGHNITRIRRTTFAVAKETMEWVGSRSNNMRTTIIE